MHLHKDLCIPSLSTVLNLMKMLAVMCSQRGRIPSLANKKICYWLHVLHITENDRRGDKMGMVMNLVQNKNCD